MMKKMENQQLFKEVMGNYPTGVTVITATDNDGKPVGLTVNSFASVSLEPLMVLWCIDHKVSTIKTFTEGGKFAVHVLAGDQQELCKTFASKNVDRFSTCTWDFSDNDVSGELAFYNGTTRGRVRMQRGATAARSNSSYADADGCNARHRYEP